MKDIVPDYMNALVGYRAWNVTPNGELISINSNVDEPWAGKTKKQAICTQITSRRGDVWAGSQMWNQSYCTTQMYVRPAAAMRNRLQPSGFGQWWHRRRAMRDLDDHHAPAADCTCGIYAAKSDKSPHFESYRCAAPVWGEVWLWGKVQEYSGGYRAEFAYPKALSTTSQHAERIAQLYGVPCERVDGAITISAMPSTSALLSTNWPTTIMAGSGSTSVGSFADVPDEPPLTKQRLRGLKAALLAKFRPGN